MKGFRLVVVLAFLASSIHGESLSVEKSDMLLQSQVKTLNTEIKSLKSAVNALKQAASVSAFHAEGSKSDIPNGSVIMFGNVKTNTKGNYNPSSSHFLCPNTGLYLFYVTLSAYSASGYGQVWYQIVQDGSLRASGVTGNGNHGPVGTHFAMIQCHPNSRIWVRQGGSSPSWRQGMWTQHSQFGGFEISN